MRKTIQFMAKMNINVDDKRKKNCIIVELEIQYF